MIEQLFLLLVADYRAGNLDQVKFDAVHPLNFGLGLGEPPCPKNAIGFQAAALSLFALLGWRRGGWEIRVYAFATRSQSGLRVHSSAPSAFRAPILRSNRSVVERSAAMPFSSCPVDLNPLADRGSFSIARSLRFWFHS